MERRYCSSSESESDVSSSSLESEGGNEELCEYEKKRMENIRRNQEMMKSLGEWVKEERR